MTDTWVTCLNLQISELYGIHNILFKMLDLIIQECKLKVK